MVSAQRSCLAIVLAAGEGTRMRSAKPKVLHEIAGRSLLSHVLGAVGAAGADRLAVVIGPDRPDVAKAVSSTAPHAAVFEQRERHGTAHAVLAARAAFDPIPHDVVVAFGDTPLVEAETFSRLRAPLTEGADVVVLGFEARDPHGYGRLIRDNGTLTAIREHRDASEAERAITLCNAGLMALSGRAALEILDAIDNRNAKGEFYLTDAVEVALRMGLKTAVVVAPEAEVQGINDRVQLSEAEDTLQKRLRHQALLAGATLTAPDTVFFSADTVLGQDVTVEPFVVFGPGVTVEPGATIRAHSHLEGAHVGAGAIVGPYARLRPGARLGANVHVGNFVEIKNASLGTGTKANHLAYIGDATVGEATNIGAGTITCNYDGFAKHRTVIGDNAFIGTNSSLVAPVTIASGAYIGSGSVITKDVPADALAVGRARQVVKEGWAASLRARAKPKATG